MRDAPPRRNESQKHRFAAPKLWTISGVMCLAHQHFIAGVTSASKGTDFRIKPGKHQTGLTPSGSQSPCWHEVPVQFDTAVSVFCLEAKTDTYCIFMQKALGTHVAVRSAPDYGVAVWARHPAHPFLNHLPKMRTKPLHPGAVTQSGIHRCQSPTEV